MKIDYSLGDKRRVLLRAGLLFVILMAGCAAPPKDTPEKAFYRYDYPLAMKGFKAQTIVSKDQAVKAKKQARSLEKSSKSPGESPQKLGNPEAKEQKAIAKEAVSRLAAIKAGQQISAEVDNDYVLKFWNVGSSALLAGDYYDAKPALRSVSAVLDDYLVGAGKGTASLWLRESIRLYKGEPYEAAMSYVYRGIMFYNTGNYDNARAAFSRAILADSRSAEEGRADFGLAYFLLGHTYLKLADEDNAEIAFKKVRSVNPNNKFANLESAKSANLILLIEVGGAPFKRPDAIVGSVDVIQLRLFPERYAEIYIDDKLVGRSVQVLDLLHQAKTRGTSGKDVAQAVKGTIIGIGKQLPLIGLFFSIAEATGVGKADIRTWHTLPGSVHVFSANVEPGVHTVRLKFYNSEGKHLERFDQTHYFVPVGLKRQNRSQMSGLFLIRSGMDVHNVHPEKKPPPALIPQMRY